MSTKASRSAARLMLAPAVILLLAWMLVPLTMTLVFSFQRNLPLRGGFLEWVGFENYVRFVTSNAFWPAVQTTIVIVGGVLLITVVLDSDGGGHAVLTVATDEGDLILDNLTSEVLPWHETPYRFVKRQSAADPSQWVSLRRSVPSPEDIPVAGSD